MTATSRFIFLLTPANSSLDKKIVWAKDEGDARMISDLIVIAPDTKVSEMKAGIYSDVNTLCMNITDKVNVTYESKDGIHFEFDGKSFALGIGVAKRY